MFSYGKKMKVELARLEGTVIVLADFVVVVVVVDIVVVVDDDDVVFVVVLSQKPSIKVWSTLGH